MSPAAGTNRARRHLPLASTLPAMAALLIVLPSALQVPQANPTQTIEFAPIPPDEDEPPPPDDNGDITSLGLGSSSAGPAAPAGPGGGGVLTPPPPAPTGLGERPITKRCVGEPPRQTEDPLAPPCVAHFEGDNGGATHRGVNTDEIRIIIPIDPAGGSSDANQAGEYVDLSKPEEDTSSLYRPGLRALVRYFNQRFQTYDRTVHAWVYYNTRGADDAPSPETRRADATANLADVDPFAVLTSQFLTGGEQDYIETVAGRDVLSFGSSKGPARSAIFDRFPALVWSYNPTVKTVADRFSEFVCQRVIPFPVVASGNGEDLGRQRRLGLLATTDANYPNLVELAALVREQVEACGGEFAETGTFPTADRFWQYNSDDPAALYATSNMARFEAADVTTVIWPGGFETDQSRAAQQAGYLPEWIVAGDGLTDSAVPAHQQGQQAWAHATVVTYNIRTDSAPDPSTREYENDPHFMCPRAILEGDPSASPTHIANTCNTSAYEDLRQLFTGIQVAGPTLSPDSIDRGFHAIPALPSTSPYQPSCFYDPGDYTCVKDAMVQWWWPGNGQEGYANDGCYRMVDGGRRWLTWQAANLDAGRTADDPCNRFNRLAAAL